MNVDKNYGACDFTQILYANQTGLRKTNTPPPPPENFELFTGSPLANYGQCFICTKLANQRPPHSHVRLEQYTPAF